MFLADLATELMCLWDRVGVLWSNLIDVNKTTDQLSSDLDSNGAKTLFNKYAYMISFFLRLIFIQSPDPWPHLVEVTEVAEHYYK